MLPLFVSLALVFILIPSAVAQDYVKNLRPEGNLFVKPRIGSSFYLGDNEKSPFNFNGDAFEIGLPWNAGVELGYQLSVPFSLSLSFSAGEYPVITQFPARTDDIDGVKNDDVLRTSVQALGRYAFAKSSTRTALYLNFGLVYSFGNVTQDLPPYTTEESGSTFGPLVGLGVDIALNTQTSFFAEFNSGIHLDDQALDGTSQHGYGASDLLNSLGIGFKINFAKAITPPEIGALTCPTGSVMTNSSADFSVSTNSDVATQPIELRWEFGDGATAAGDMATHTYTEGGTYNVMFFATSEYGTASGGCSVTVLAPAEILALTASNESVSVCDEDPSITFTANAAGSEQLTYRWNFGDGQTSFEASPSHTYAEPGSYTVTLELLNDAGRDMRTVDVNVTEQGCFECDISEMNTAFFDRNSSVLTDTGRIQLMENLQILQNCDLNVRLEGYASRDERNAQQLSEDRAEAVKQYYIDNGIDESRITQMGMGRSGQSSKKGAGALFRRVDTIPVN
ncbi:MAG: PKD domain-containing protein [Bacteroidetes bacterium]|nr:PKD domain-containing protein [Bacteroidota bacterium]